MKHSEKITNSNEVAMKFINLTPHTVYEYITGQSFKMSGTVARVKLANTNVGMENGVVLYSTAPGFTIDLPDQSPGTMYIVSSMVRINCPKRTDLLSPHILIRNSHGMVIGCQSFEVNLPIYTPMPQDIK